MPEKIFVIWKLRPRPARVRAWTESFVMSRPFRITWPALNVAWPDNAFISVVLPAPLGPISP